MPALLPPLRAVDPIEAWEPWRPSAADPWSLKWAGHLYRRAAFGATPAELRQAVTDGPAVTLDRVLKGAADAGRRDQFLAGLGDKTVPGGDLEQLRAWWVYALLYTQHPLREKLVLFWHNHFATSVAKVQQHALMYAQNKLLRRHALGSFRSLLLDMGRDPAMLLWLDSNSNVRAHPNENYARELMELFSLGVGHYTEKDVREAARAFTGRQVDGEHYAFNNAEHDAGEKTFLGRKGRWDGNDVVRIILEQPAAARFVVGKLYRFFISETATPPDALLEPLARIFRDRGYQIAPVVEHILRSRLFFSEHAYRQRVKSPVDYVLGAVRAVWEGPVPPTLLASRLESMGQALFAPPNVKGWPGGRAWLTTSTVLARSNFALTLSTGGVADDGGDEPRLMRRDNPPDPDRDPARLVRREKLTSPERIVERFTELLLDGQLDPAARSRLVAFLGEGRPSGAALDERVREVVHALLTTPDYQLA